MTRPKDSQTPTYWLAILCSVGDAAQWADWLMRQGFAAVEERSAPGGIEVVVYDESLERLQVVARQVDCFGGEGGAGATLPAQATMGQLDPDWRLAWTQYLQPVALTSTYTVVPTVAPAQPKVGEIYLEPALAFGFGEHPSTTLLSTCLQEVCTARASCSVLDVGCGTGVLSLLAALCGAHRVVGVDISHDAVQAAERNAVNNRLEGRVAFALGSAQDVPGPFDVVCANIESGVLVALAPAIVSQLAPRGQVLLAGLLREQKAEVQAAYRELGVQLAEPKRWTDPGGEWCLLASAPWPCEV